MWLEIKTDLMWVVVGVEGENRNKLGACQYVIFASVSFYKLMSNNSSETHAKYAGWKYCTL